jgi:hypothetical protein
MEVTTSASFAWLRATSRTLKPARASCVANSRPMPSDAPVTTVAHQLCQWTVRSSTGMDVTGPRALLRAIFA